MATLPPPQTEQMFVVAGHPLVDGVRFNIGARTPYSPKETLERIIAAIGDKEFWLDLKGRQLRITKWAVPTYGDIELNHNIKVDLPATIIFRGSNKSTIVEIKDNKIFVDPIPREAVGDGQAVNIHGSNLEIDGYLTSEDMEYVNAAKELGLHKYMLSFVEEESDISELTDLDPEAIMCAKIESPKGLEFVREIYPKFCDKITLIAAMDDLYTNIGEDKTVIFEALGLIIKKDPQAIAASRILTSLEESEIVSMSDMANFRFLESIGYRSFMLSDGLCGRAENFKRAMLVLKQYKDRFGWR
ncbi:hypothetical protein KAT63_02465 [Candidatus Parcubacteria bacterium]|nr:hypothetical protein [Candidatus Parcubacteria bacterium]